MKAQSYVHYDCYCWEMWVNDTHVRPVNTLNTVLLHEGKPQISATTWTIKLIRNFFHITAWEGYGNGKEFDTHIIGLLQSDAEWHGTTIFLAGYYYVYFWQLDEFVLLY